MSGLSYAPSREPLLKTKVVLSFIGSKQNKIAPGTALTAEAIQDFLAQLKAKNLSPDPLRSYTAALEKLQAFLGPGGTIYPGAIEAWRKKMQQDGYANSTINTHVRCKWVTALSAPQRPGSRYAGLERGAYAGDYPQRVSVAPFSLPSRCTRLTSWFIWHSPFCMTRVPCAQHIGTLFV